ncbi:MAG TPA: WXG100 family type VII secretion target [Anaerolineae bacterium]|nr:WXG100 family type VII secretion target [Anaerolineae bacterium]HMR63248.1 WXG100 family type VII secretion target [Anaerolineae bacterium]
MSNDIIRMDYDLMQKMAQDFQYSAEELQDMLTEIQNIANQMNEGALVGRGGDAFEAALRGPLSSTLTKLIMKFQELRTDVIVAMKEMKEADVESAQKF